VSEGQLSKRPGFKDESSTSKVAHREGCGLQVLGDFREPTVEHREMDLGAALKETIGYQMGTFISCIPGKLAYFEDESSRYILER
jgi:hypothetical protein